MKVVRDELHSDWQTGLERDLCGDGGGRDAGKVGRLRAIVQPGSVVAVVGEGEIRKSVKIRQNSFTYVRQTQMGSITYLGAVESVTGVRSTSMPESKARLKSSDTSLRTLSA